MQIESIIHDYLIELLAPQYPLIEESELVNLFVFKRKKQSILKRYDDFNRKKRALNNKATQLECIFLDDEPEFLISSDKTKSYDEVIAELKKKFRNSSRFKSTQKEID